MNYPEIIAALINSVLVLMIVQLLKTKLPVLREKFPVILPIITPVIGPLVVMAQNLVTNWLGYQVDLSPIVGVFSGSAAVMLYQVKKQAEPGKVGGR